MSVQELRARIDELSTNVILHKKLLKQLKHDKILAQRQLNAVTDPVAHLPSEISSEIFIQSLAPLEQPGALHATMLLLNICSAWSTIALSTPALWASRARNRPLSISLHGDFGKIIHCLFAVIWRYGGQLKHLEISEDETEVRFFQDDSNIDGCFGNTSPSPLPLLEKLMIRGLIDWRQFRHPQIIQLLRLVPNIVEWVFDCQ
ncbi:hypothetical protein B0H14DRAFT_3505904 [Mycena olivaceomarginata]|nr:hypothetical protein B0H14DRAFT_3505904 [Mycena olivaceomarginata]